MKRAITLALVMLVSAPTSSSADFTIIRSWLAEYFACPNMNWMASCTGGCETPITAPPRIGPSTFLERVFPAVGGDNGAKTVGGLVDLLRASTVQDVVDFSAPLSHGSSLFVRRVFSGAYSHAENRSGHGAFGYANASGTTFSNWHLYLYESKVKIVPGETDMLLWVDEMGNWIHFVFDAEANSGGGLESPMPPDVGGSSGFPSLYLPYGDGRIAPKIFDPSETAPWVRQTDRNLQLILINQEEPEEPEDRIDIDNIEFFVIRDADGPQYHYWPDGRLVYVDFNWRNNYLGDIPDYLRVIWSEGAYAKGTNEEVPALDRVIAANGGYLRFNHPTGEVPGVGSNETFAHVESISYFPFGAGAGPGSINVANYEYRANGENTGRLWRSWPTNSDTAGVQYDYGAGVYESTPNTVTFYENNFQWSNVQELAGISQITPTGTPGAPDVKPLVFLSGYGDDSVMVFIHDPPADPEEDEPWRHAFEIDESLQVKWHDGDGYYGQYSPSLTKGESYLLSSFSYDAVRAIYTDANDEPPGLQKIFYDQPDSEMTNRLIESTKVYAGFAGLATEEMAAFAALTTLLMPAAVQPTPTAWVISEEVDHYDAIAGYGRVTEIRRYAEYEQDGENYVPVENATFTTTLDYGSTEPAITALGVPWPEKIDLPGGARLLLSYTDDGRPTTVQEQILIDTQYVTVATTTYDYFEGDFETLLQSVTVEIENGPSQTIEFTYTTSGPPDNFMPGRLRTVTVDDEVTTFTFNSLGNLIRLETEEGEIEYQYAYGVHPPRLDKVIDAEGVETTLDYDDLGRVASLTIADGLALEKTTTYEYDHHWNVSKVATPDGAETEFAYDIYGQLVRLIDAEGTVFNYSYDEFGRVYREEVTDGPEGDVQYSIDYKYVSGDGSGGTGCGTCAGGAFQIAERTITYGEDPEESETLYYTYDLLGRLRSENSDPESPEIIYTYDGLNLASIEHAGDAELYGDSTLRFEYDDSNRLVREIYPNGRYIEYSYDDSQRLAAVKDPFGFITTLTYDDDEDGRLDAIAHSTIGVATFEYNSDDLLSKLTLGNGAYTTYAYDAYFRLTAFDTYDASESRLIKHDWSYDDLGRKKEGGTGGGVNVTGETNLTKIAFEYDAAGRLAYEDYNGGYWDVDYDYDDAGNRTLRRLMALGETDEYDISYGAANRESSLDGNWEYQIQDFDGALEYDFKGNVLTRVPLADAQLESIANYEYTWDSRDRMRRVDRSGTFSAFYDYDAGGRMLRRRVGLSGGPYAPAELHYWLGLNRLATEAGGDAQAVLRPSSGANYSGLDPEPGDEPGDDGWSLPAWTSSPDDGVLEYVNDADRGRVLKFSTEASGPVDDTFLIGEPDSLGWNPIDEEFEITDRNVFSIWVRNANTSQKFYIIALVRTWDGDATYTDRYMMFRTESGTDFENSPWLGYYIGGSYNDNEWHYLEFDLEAKLQEQIPGEELVQVDGLYFYAKEIYVDDFALSSGRLEKSYALIPGAAIGGYLGAQSGAAGGAAGGATPAWSTWYYHFNDLGTVLATTDSGGDAIGVYEPDFFGNYTQTVVAEGDGGEGGEGGGEGGFQALTVPETPAPRPDTLGLQSKFFDPWAGLYDFGLRWLDPERGRWMSEEPLGLDGPNLYQFVFNAPLGYWDFMGLNGSQLTGDPYIDWFYERNEKFSKGHAYVFPEVMRQAWDSSDEVFEELSRLPVVGAIGDAANAFVYTCKGEYTKAGISFFWFAMPGNGKLWDDVLERHHLLPKEFKNWFKDRGLNVEDFVMVIGRSMHRYKPNGLHTGLNGDNWNAVWRAFKENNPTATRQEIIDQMLRMLDDFWKRFD